MPDTPEFWLRLAAVTFTLTIIAGLFVACRKSTLDTDRDWVMSWIVMPGLACLLFTLGMLFLS